MSSLVLLRKCRRRRSKHTRQESSSSSTAACRQRPTTKRDASAKRLQDSPRLPRSPDLSTCLSRPLLLSVFLSLSASAHSACLSELALYASPRTEREKETKGAEKPDFEDEKTKEPRLSTRVWTSRVSGVHCRLCFFLSLPLPREPLSPGRGKTTIHDKPTALSTPTIVDTLLLLVLVLLCGYRHDQAKVKNEARLLPERADSKEDEKEHTEKEEERGPVHRGLFLPADLHRREPRGASG